MLRNRFTQLSFLLLLSAVTTAAIAGPPPGKGKGGGGEEESPPEPVLPPIELVETVIPMPVANPYTLGVSDINEGGSVVGFFQVGESANDRRAFLYTPDSVTVDLNEVEMQGLPASWVIQRGLGINNNDLIVGYAAPFGVYADRRGFVLDMASTPPQFYELPDTSYGWEYSYAGHVNDNGDVLGRFKRNDGTFGLYLYNVATDIDLELIDENVGGWFHTGIDNPLPGEPPTIVFDFADNVGFFAEYTRGSNVVIHAVDGDASLNRPQISSNGIVAARFFQRTYINKKRSTTSNHLYRSDGLLDEFTPAIPNHNNNPYPTSINSSGTTVLRTSGATGYGLQLYHDDWGFVEIGDIATLFNDLSGSSYMNDSGILGFSQIVANGNNITTGAPEAVILTPIEIP